VMQVRRGECSPQDSQASTISLDTVDQWQPSASDAPQASVDDRISEILVTLNSLSAELANISRARQHESSERLAGETTSTIPRETRSENGDGESVMTEEAAFQHWRSSCTTVKLNVGGKVFHVSWSLMLQVPNSRLANLARCSRGDELLDYCDSYDRANNEVFFNHRYRNMVDILDYYRCGSLHISNDCCPMAFVADLSYWGLPETCLEPCCLKKWVECREQVEWEQAKVEVKEEEWQEGANQLQRRLWNLFEHPHTSLLARIIGIISVSCIFISTIILTLDTLPYFKEHESQIDGEFAAFVIIEAVYMAYFTVEFIIRLIACPSKRDFLRRSMNWIDLLAIVPYFVTVTLKWYGVTEAAIAEDHLSEEEHAGDVSRTAQYFRLLKMARIVKTLRIIRIFKLARHSTGLQALGNTMKANYKELGLLFLLLGMGAIMFASLIFVFEKEDADTTFKTMFDAYWWAIITMTTVGYGDVSPVTGFGKILGCFCAIFGVLVIGLPIPIIGNSFTKFYTRQKRWEKNEAQSSKEKKGKGVNSNLQTINIDDGKPQHSERGL